MADTTNIKGIVFIARTGFSYYSSGSKGVASFNFDDKFVRDLDVIDPKSLVSAIGTFLDQAKLIPCPVLFVFSEQTTFFQDVPEAEISKIEAVKEDFVNTVPFETLLTKSYSTKGGIRVVSINEKLYRYVAEAFQAKGFLSLGVIPTFVLGDRGSNLTTLDPNSGSGILSNIENLRDQSFFSSHAKQDSENNGGGKPVIEKSFKFSKSLLLLIPVFVVLIGVLVFLLTRPQ